MTIAHFTADIDFALEDAAEFGHKTAPMLRYVAGLSVCTDYKREDFIAACVAKGYNAGTAGVCWAAGRKFMIELDKEAA